MLCNRLGSKHCGVHKARVQYLEQQLWHAVDVLQGFHSLDEPKTPEHSTQHTCNLDVCMYCHVFPSSQQLAYQSTQRTVWTWGGQSPGRPCGTVRVKLDAVPRPGQHLPPLERPGPGQWWCTHNATPCSGPLEECHRLDLRSYRASSLHLTDRH